MITQSTCCRRVAPITATTRRRESTDDRDQSSDPVAARPALGAHRGPGMAGLLTIAGGLTVLSIAIARNSSMIWPILDVVPMPLRLPVYR